MNYPLLALSCESCDLCQYHAFPLKQETLDVTTRSTVQVLWVSASIDHQGIVETKV